MLSMPLANSDGGHVLVECKEIPANSCSNYRTQSQVHLAAEFNWKEWSSIFTREDRVFPPIELRISYFGESPYRPD